ncbi:MAG: FHA domain-containing protein [Labilithrix sp.]|nr:FHA domain-containing protein [Labilithrix sp.]MCW5834538.1 FHA domain-containing protein [Labilithrix sp.]
MSTHLQILLGRERGRAYAVAGGSYVLGRGTDSDLILASEIVSRRHASVVVGPNDLRVTDLGSSNGTFINGARVLGEGVAVRGDILLVGDVALRVHGHTVPALSPVRPDSEPGTSFNLSGNLLEVPPSTLLRYLAVIKKTGEVLLTSPPLQSRVAFTRGHIGEVFVDGRKTRDPIQALTAILRWKGAFEVGESSSAGSSLLLGLDSVLPPVGSSSRPSTLPKPPRL